MNMYANSMKCTATELRKTLFAALDRAAAGEPWEITHKGSTIHLIPGQTGAKLARAKRQHALLVDPGAIVESDSDLVSAMHAEAENDWNTF